MSTPIVVIHPCALFHDGLRQIFAGSRFRPVRIAAKLTEEMETYLQSLESCVWLIAVDRCASTTNALVRRVVAKSQGVKVVILAAYQIPDDVFPALSAGARGFLSQDIRGEQLIKSLELIDAGETVVQPQLSCGQIAIRQTQANAELKDNDVWQAENSGSPPTPHTASRPSSPAASIAMERSTEIPTRDVVQILSRRELLILRQLTEGASNKVIARKLVITESTVKVHMKSILRKLRLQNRTQAAIWARTYVNEEERNCPALALAH